MEHRLSKVTGSVHGHEQVSESGSADPGSYVQRDALTLSNSQCEGALMNALTPETALLNRHPGAREHVAALPDFISWRDALPVVEVDNERLYVIGGDQLKDHDQIIVAWLNQFRPDFLREFGHE